MLPTRTVCTVASALLVALLSPVAVAEDTTDCKQLSFKETFANGFSQRWEQLAGAEYEQSIVTPGDGSAVLNLRSTGTGNTQLVTRALFQSARVEWTMQTNARDRVMYNLVAWPPANKAGSGEMDLELLGNRPDALMMPMYAPGVTETTPILINNPPAAWNAGSDAGGPTLDLGSATAYSEVSWVKPAGFSQTEKTKFTFEYSADTITWTANGKVYAKYTKGTDASLWPYGEPMMLSFSLWTNVDASYDWMGGQYEYNAEDPAALTISDFSFDGCVVNYAEATSGSSDDGNTSGNGQGSGNSRSGNSNAEGSSATPVSSGGPGGSTGGGEDAAQPTQSSVPGSAKVSNPSASVSANVSGSASGSGEAGGQTSTVWVQPMEPSTSGEDGDEEQATASLPVDDDDDDADPAGGLGDDTAGGTAAQGEATRDTGSTAAGYGTDDSAASSLTASEGIRALSFICAALSCAFVV